MLEFVLVIVLLLLLFFTLVILYKIFLDLKNSYDEYKETKEKPKDKGINLKYNIKNFSITDIFNKKKKKKKK